MPIKVFSTRDGVALSMAARYGRRADKFLRQHYIAKEQTAAAAIRILTSQEAHPKDSADAVTLATNLASRVADTPIAIECKVSGAGVGFRKMKLAAGANKKGGRKRVVTKTAYKKVAVR